MLFPTFEFFAFFSVVLFFNWTLKRWPFFWRLFLLVSSYFFYSVWDFRFCLILFFISLSSFITGLLIDKSLKRKKLFLLFSLFFSLSALFLFKYYDFFRASAEALLLRFGFAASLPLLFVFLPVGLSFYTFRAISYNVDVYRGKIKASNSLLDFMVYISFFPQLLSGPIARAEEFLPQLESGGVKKVERPYYYITLILSGLFKKLVISSYLSMSFVDDVFAVPENHSSILLFLAIFAYTLIIYFDFSGYSDLAIGFAGLMGFSSPKNFDFPYLSQNIKDFWRRWHISFSSWIKDYIYIPLGGNRKGELRKHLNLMAAMVFAGLWHGAGLNFIAWGAFHGLGLTATHIFLADEKTDEKKSVLSRFSAWIFTFLFVSIGWVIFREPTMKSVFLFFKSLFSFERLAEPFDLYILLHLFLGYIFVFWEKGIKSASESLQKKMPMALWFLFVIFAFLLIFALAPETIPPFIYFKF